jgi:hypothetical protein
MSLWDDLSSGASDWWSGEKDKVAGKAKSESSNYLTGLWDDASDSVTDWFKGGDDKEKAKQDSAALIGANQKTVSENPTVKQSSGINWTAASVGVGLLGLAAKFLK